MFEIPETETYPSSFQYSISHPWERDFYIELCNVEMVEYIMIHNYIYMDIKMNDIIYEDIMEMVEYIIMMK